MNKVISMLLVIFAFTMNIVLADGDPSKPLVNDSKSKTQVQKFNFEYNKALKEHNYRTGKKPIDFYIDFQLGVGVTSPNITSASGVGEYQTSSKLGFKTGALFFISIFDAVSFSSGLSFNGKSFGITTPSLVPPTVDTTKIKKNQSIYVAANYLNIPLNVHFGGMVSESVGLDFNGGPYFGIRMSSPDNVSNGSGFKDFDLGLNGTVTGHYVVAYPLSILFGVDFQYGGLNNLGKTAMVDRITTLNYSFFSGVRVGF